MVGSFLVFSVTSPFINFFIFSCPRCSFSFKRSIHEWSPPSGLRPTALTTQTNDSTDKLVAVKTFAKFIFKSSLFVHSSTKSLQPDTSAESHTHCITSGKLVQNRFYVLLFCPLTRNSV